MEKNKKKKMTYGLWCFIKDDEIHPFGLASLQKYQEIMSPLLETRLTHPISMMWDITNQNKQTTLNLVYSYYKDLINAGIYVPGRYGDWIKTSILTIEDKKYLNLDIVGQAAWYKPTLAADLGIFIKGRHKIFFVGIIRRNQPGKGKPAIIGGIMNTKKVLDSGAYTMLKETEEECNLKLKYLGDLDRLRENYNIKKVPVQVIGLDIISPLLEKKNAFMRYVTTIPTSEQERNQDGTKRVYLSVAYELFLDLEIEIKEEDLRQIFTAGDDAQDIFIEDITTCFSDTNSPTIPEFGLDHHPRLFLEMIHVIQEYELRNSTDSNRK